LELVFCLLWGGELYTKPFFSARKRAVVLSIKRCIRRTKMNSVFVHAFPFMRLAGVDVPWDRQIDRGLLSWLCQAVMG
jgi:hypothetical protein